MDCNPAIPSIGTDIGRQRPAINHEIKAPPGCIQDFKPIGVPIQSDDVSFAIRDNIEGGTVKGQPGQLRKPFADFQGLNGSVSVGPLVEEVEDGAISSDTAVTRKASDVKFGS